MTSTDSFTGRIKTSITQSPVRQGTDRKRNWSAYENLILHVHPKKIPLEALRFTLTWGLGGICSVLFVLLAISGMMLLFVYEPFPEKAYQSVLMLQHTVMFGQLIRNIHHWSANFLIIVSFLHLLRVFFTGGFHSVRRFNWVIGIVLFTGILVSNFTGYLLPWDQLAYWAVTISTEMTEYIPLAGSLVQEFLRGGNETAAANLMLFFTLHTTVIPGFLFLLMIFHFWRVRKAGGVVIPVVSENSEKPLMVGTVPNLVLREGVVALSVIAVILIISIIVNAPLGDMANPGLSPNPAKAPWYFLGFQELLLHFHPVFAVFFIPVTLFLLITALPYFRYDQHHTGKWFISETGKRSAVAALLTAVILVPSAIILNEYVITVQDWLPGIPGIISDGFIPVLIVGLIIILFYLYLKTYIKTTINETLQALFVLVVVSFIILMITGIWFRGEGMALS